MSNYILMNMCMILNSSTNQVLIQDKVHPKWAGITFPGGHVENAESIYESTVRAMKEETGLDVFDLEQAGLIHMYNPENHDRRLIFLYKTSHFEGNLIDETHEGKTFWMSIYDLESMELAPHMREYLKVFTSKQINEAYVTPNANKESDFSFFG